jgi:hypothetical protein
MLATFQRHSIFAASRWQAGAFPSPIERLPLRVMEQPGEGLRPRALEHRQFPLPALFVAPQYIEVAIAASDLDVAIAGPMPHIDIFVDFDLSPAQPEPLRHRFWTAGLAFNLNLQRWFDTHG